MQSRSDAPGRAEGTSMVFRAFRLAGVIDIAITGIVYHLTLADLQELDGKAAVADQLLHTAIPILAVAGWPVFGPRGLTSWRVVAWSTVIPWLDGVLGRRLSPGPDPVRSSPAAGR